MKTKKRKRLEGAGWKVGSAKDLLGLTRKEAAFVALKLTLSVTCINQKGLLGDAESGRHRNTIGVRKHVSD